VLCVCVCHAHCHHCCVLQFGTCVQCPAARAASIGSTVGIVVGFIVVGTGLFLIRSLIPVDVVKVGLSMVQIVASGSTAYDIPSKQVSRGLCAGISG
jgi:hypothetical protein